MEVEDVPHTATAKYTAELLHLQMSPAGGFVK